MSLYPMLFGPRALLPSFFPIGGLGFGVLGMLMTRYLVFGLGSLALLEDLVDPEDNKANGDCDDN